MAAFVKYLGHALQISEKLPALQAYFAEVWEIRLRKGADRSGQRNVQSEVPLMTDERVVAGGPDLGILARGRQAV
jgi:hypothetical protein